MSATHSRSGPGRGGRGGRDRAPPVSRLQLAPAAYACHAGRRLPSRAGASAGRPACARPAGGAVLELARAHAGRRTSRGSQQHPPDQRTRDPDGRVAKERGRARHSSRPASRRPPRRAGRRVLCFLHLDQLKIAADRSPWRRKSPPCAGSPSPHAAAPAHGAAA
jgi:hypothetical protein